MREEELGPGISSQLAEMAIKYWSEESKSLVVVNETLEDLKITSTSGSVSVSILNETMSFH